MKQALYLQATMAGYPRDPNQHLFVLEVQDQTQPMVREVVLYDPIKLLSNSLDFWSSLLEIKHVIGYLQIENVTGHFILIQLNWNFWVGLKDFHANICFT